MEPKQPRPLVAALLMLAASAFIALSTLFAKLVRTDALGPELPAFVVTLGRFGFAFAALLAVAAVWRPSFTRPAFGLHIARSACGFGGITLMFTAVALIPLGDATAISFLNPVFAMVFAIPLLGERVGPWRWAAAAVALAGAAILLRPGGGTVAPGALFAFGSAVVIGLEVIFIHRLSRRERPLQILIVNNGFGVLFAATAALFVWASPNPAQMAALAGVGLSMLCAQVAFINAMARADASFAVPFTYATIVFATLYDAVIFGTRPDTQSLFGGLVIIAGGAILAWREGRANRRTPVAATR